MARTSGQSQSTLEDALHASCYDEILSHTEQWKQEENFDRVLNLMAPGHFWQFADQAHKGATNITVDCMSQIFSEEVRSNDAYLRGLRPTSATQREVFDRLHVCLTPFQHAIQRYDGTYQRFLHVAAETTSAAFENSFRIGRTVTEVTGRIFGPIGSLIASFGAGYLVGKQAENRIESEGQLLEQAFHSMLASYDQAMTDLHSTALDMLSWYYDQITAAQQPSSRRAIAHR